MTDLTLVIGNRNYSSWSLRPWFLMKQSGIAFVEDYLPLHSTSWKKRIRDVSPSGRVPVLHDRDTRVWDSLAICEYLAERFPEHRLWPHERSLRAEARSISAEMHSGFMALRQNMFMNIRLRMPGHGRTPETLADIQRIQDIWNSCRSRFQNDGPFLFGRFSIADAMYAPVALRFQTYGVAPAGAAADYTRTILDLPAIQDWIAASLREEHRLSMYEPADA